MKRLATGAVLGALSMLLLLSSGSLAQRSSDSRLTEVLKRGHLVAGVTSTAPPFGFRDEKGEIAGFDIDIARMIAKSLFNDPNKIKLEILAQDARWAAVQAGKVDVAMMATTIYADRAQKVAFTRGYIDSGFAILARKDGKLSKWEQVNDPKVKIASRTIPSQKDRLQKYFPKAQALFFDSPADQFLAVKSGRADALQTDLPIVRWYAKQNPELKFLGQFTSTANNGIFMQQGDFNWWLYVDTVVSEMLTGSLYDEYSTVYQKWFGEEPPPQRFYHSRS